MKYYIQFKTLSTGYVEGTIPPIFKDENKKPIDLCGSDGVYILDGRLNIHSMISKALDVFKNHISKKYIVGFDIIKSTRFVNDGKIVYTTII